MAENSSLERAAFMRPTSVDEANRTVELVIASEANVGGLVLRCAADAVEMGPAPVPVLLDHYSEIDRMAGRLTDVRFQDGQMIGTAQFIDAPAAEMGWQLARSGCAVSVRATFSPADVVSLSADADMVRRWRLGHAALVPEGADVACLTRSKTDSLPMEDLTKTGESPVAVAPAVAVETAAVERAVAPAAAALDETGRQLEQLRAETLELKREARVREAGQLAGLDAAQVAEVLEATRGKSIEESVIEVVRRHRVAVEAAAPVHAGHPARTALSVSRDEGETVVRSYEAELERRAGILKAPSEVGKAALGLTALEMCRGYLQSRGVNTQGMSKNAVVERAFHSTSDFPLLFENIASKTLLAAYAEEPQTWAPLARQRNLPDFKAVSDYQVAGQIVPEKILEGGEYTSATVTEGKATWNLATYGRRVAITRQSIINDDLDALSRVPEMLGRGCRLLESNMVWDLITNGSLGATVSLDNKALFHADHNNTISGATTTIGIAGMDAAKVKLRKQSDLAGNRLNLAPAYLLVPLELETAALQFLFPTGYAPANLTGASGPNPFAGGVQLIVEPRLSDDSTAMWYLASSPNRVEMITYGYLAGEVGPTITQTENRNPDGIELLVRMDFGCTLSDYRGFVRSAGA
jgi:hypothetical protein